MKFLPATFNQHTIMQTFNSFNALAAAQHAAPLQSQMSVFNADDDGTVALLRELKQLDASVDAAIIAAENEYTSAAEDARSPLKRIKSMVRNLIPPVQRDVDASAAYNAALPGKK